MGLFGGGRAATAEQAKRAEQERAFLQGVVMHVMPDEFRSSVKTQATRSATPTQPSVAVTAAPPPTSSAPRPSEKGSGAPKSVLVSLSSSKKLLIVWGGVAVLAIGGTVGVLVLVPSPQPLPQIPTGLQETVEPIVPTPAVEEPPVASPAEKPPQPRVAPDSDGDGVSDPEEALYGSDATKSDTDGDGYSDQLEILNLYNPAGTAPVRLVESGRVVASPHPVGAYTVLTPRGWSVEQSGTGMRVTAPEGAVVEVAVHENPQRLSAETWYRLQAEAEIAGSFISVAEEGMEGVVTPDRLTAIVTRSRKDGGPDRMAVIRMNTGDLPLRQYETTLTMMARSFQWAR